MRCHFSFHNLRQSLALFLATNKKTDVKTVQRSLRQSSSSITLEKYVQTDMEESVIAQKLISDVVFQYNDGAVN